MWAFFVVLGNKLNYFVLVDNQTNYLSTLFVYSQPSNIKGLTLCRQQTSISVSKIKKYINIRLLLKFFSSLKYLSICLLLYKPSNIKGLKQTSLFVYTCLQLSTNCPTNNIKKLFCLLFQKNIFSNSKSTRRF